MLLQRDLVPHIVRVGELFVESVGSIGLHFWIDMLSEGLVVDLRARMWLGESELVPHGVFIPGEKVAYRATGQIEVPPDDWLFGVLAGRPMRDFPSVYA